MVFARYGLNNANAKLKRQKNDLFLSLGSQHVALVPKLFALFENGEVKLLAIRIVDDIFLTRTDNALRKLVENFSIHFTLHVTGHGPGTLSFYGLNVIQDGDFTVPIHEDDKLQALEAYPLWQTRYRQSDAPMSSFKV